jgi:hypothetical protein
LARRKALRHYVSDGLSGRDLTSEQLRLMKHDMPSDDGVVSVCIPAYEAQLFIDRTLRCAREQTYARQRIIVSIDASDDRTEDVCRAHAHDDDRIEVHAHAERLGWVDNVNYLLDSVRTEFAFIYFHDDLIEPTYSEQLVDALHDNPGAASAHSDVVLFGEERGERLRLGCTYDGTAAERLLTYFVSPNRGALLRALVRTASPVSQLRMPIAAAAYEMAFVAAGPSVHVAEPLYRRWEQRTKGLTDTWSHVSFEDVVSGMRFNMAMARQIVDSLRPTSDERAALDFGLALYATNRLRWLEATYGDTRVVGLADVLDAPVTLDVPAAVERLSEPLQSLCMAALDRARARTAAAHNRVHTQVTDP